MPDANPAPISDEISECLRKGDIDPGGSEVKEVYWTTKKYQIYNDGKQVRCKLPDDYDTATELRQWLYEISEQRANIESLREHSATRDRDRGFAARMLARCMAQAFEGHPDRALAVLKVVTTRMEAAIEGRYRMYYVAANAAALIVLLSALLTLIFFLPTLKEFEFFTFDIAEIDKYARLAIFGALGAFLSVSIGIRKIFFDVDVRPREHLYAGGSRIIIGVLGALVVGLALDSKFLSPGFGNDLAMPVFYLLTFVAGFSETLVPNTLRRVEEAADKPKDSAGGNESDSRDNPGQAA